MSLVPIKLIKNIPVRNKLLKIKDETSEIDKNDYIESRILTNKIGTLWYDSSQSHYEDGINLRFNEK